MEVEPILREKLGARGVIDLQRVLKKNKKSAHIHVMIRVDPYFITEFMATYRVELKRARFTINSSSGNIISGSVHPDNLVRIAQLVFVKKIDPGSPLFDEQ